jgi:hypothetical protein
MINISAIARRVGKLAAENSPTILTVVGVMGTITTAYLAGKATWKVAYTIGSYEDPDHDESAVMTPKERIEFVKQHQLWKAYIPAVTVGCATIACIIGANRVGIRRLAATAAAGTVIERTFDEYKEKVREKLGEKKEDAITAEIAQDRMNQNPPDEVWLQNVKLVGALDRQVCLDVFGNQYFTGSRTKIEQAINDFNHMLNVDGFGSLADLYRMLDMDTVPAWSERVGWNQDRLVEVKIDSTLVDETIPAITMNFRNEPHFDYGRFRHY